MADIIQTHRMSNLVSTTNPFLADGELIYNEVSEDLRIGDASTQYNSLPRLDMCGATQPYKTFIIYDANEVVVYLGVLYSSLQGSNTDNQPDTSPLYWEPVGSGSGETFAMNWGYDVTTTAADPGAGIFRLNNATIASSTVMYINSEDADDIDASELIEALTANDFQYIQNVADPTESILIKIVSVVDNTGWYTVTYTVEGQASATTWTDEADFGVLFMFRGGSGGGHVVQYNGTPMTQRTNLNFVSSGVVVTDDSGNDATVVTVAGGGGGSTYPSDGSWDIDIYKTTTDTPDDEFDASSLDIKWTVVNGTPGTAYPTQVSPVDIYDMTSRASELVTQVGMVAGSKFEMYQGYTIPDDKCIIMKYNPGVSYQYSNNAIWAGMSIGDSAVGPRSGDYTAFHVENDGDPALTIYDTAYRFDWSFWEVGKPIYLKIGRSGTDYYFYYSADGSNFVPAYKKTISTAPDYLWVFTINYITQSTPIPTSVFHWIREGDFTTFDPW